MRDDFLIFGSPALEEDDIAEVVATLRSGWIGTGPRVARFEEMFREYVGARHAIAVNSCTAAQYSFSSAAVAKPCVSNCPRQWRTSRKHQRRAATVS